jgi:hypothetical protein
MLLLLVLLVASLSFAAVYTLYLLEGASENDTSRSTG